MKLSDIKEHDRFIANGIKYTLLIKNNNTSLIADESGRLQHGRNETPVKPVVRCEA